ncbi:MAG: M23 family metallopeptidase, partial [Oscillospiraceae bacterium]
DLLVLIGENVEALPVAQSLLMENIKAYKDENGLMLALIPIKYTHNPGSYYVSVSLDGVKTDLPVEVLKTDFPVVDIEVDDEVKEETIESKTANDEYMTKVQPLKAVNRDKVLWQGKFMPPLKEYRITSEFGEIRTVNGAPSDRHGGLDMAAPAGTPVYATNDGEVLFAEKIQLTGNTIMIEHGLGLKSHYYHMDSLNVKAGDMVKKGDLIGTVGTTGFSTGPHLHFAVSVGRGYFNPQFVLDEEIGQ